MSFLRLAKIAVINGGYIPKGAEFLQGLLGPYLIVIPSRNIVLVRLGYKRPENWVNGAPKKGERTGAGIGEKKNCLNRDL